uniref:Uncharacterized protein n=1 Tax=Rhizophora mucronata TaxID=61149 RepID=A0A2P2P871_RHIMU
MVLFSLFFIGVSTLWPRP